MKVHPPTIPPLCMIFRIAWNCPDAWKMCHFFSWAPKILAGKCVSIPHRFLLRHIFCHWHQPLPRFLHINSVVEYLEDGPHKSKLPGLARRWSSHTQKQASPLSHTKATHYLSTNTKKTVCTSNQVHTLPGKKHFSWGISFDMMSSTGNGPSQECSMCQTQCSLPKKCILGDGYEGWMYICQSSCSHKWFTSICSIKKNVRRHISYWRL